MDDDNVLRSIDERVALELTGRTTFDEAPYHTLIINQMAARGSVTFELRCPFPVNEHGEHFDQHYCTMIDCWPTMKLRAEGAVIEMAWRAIGMCFVCWEADNAGIEHLLDVGLRIPAWARMPGQIPVVLASFDDGFESTRWLRPVDPALAALA